VSLVRVCFTVFARNEEGEYIVHESSVFFSIYVKRYCNSRLGGCLLQNKLFSNLGLGKSCSVQLEFLPTADGETPIRKTTVKGKRGEKEELPLFSNKDTIRGTVKIIPIPGKRVEHLGVRVQLLGQIELATEKSHPHEFLSLVRDLSPPGEIVSQQSLPFEFKAVEMEYESYRGSQVRLRYCVRVIIARSMGQSLIQDYFFEVQNPVDTIPTSGDSIQVRIYISSWTVYLKNESCNVMNGQTPWLILLVDGGWN